MTMVSASICFSADWPGLLRQEVMISLHDARDTGRQPVIQDRVRAFHGVEHLAGGGHLDPLHATGETLGAMCRGPGTEHTLRTEAENRVLGDKFRSDAPL